MNGNLWVLNFVNRCSYDEKFKENAFKSKQVQCGKCPALLERNLISTCYRRVKFCPAGQVEISSRQTDIMESSSK